MSTVTPVGLASAALHLQAGKYFQGAAYAMLIYDHFITFGDEVERVWKREISGASILFLLNRYLTPIQFAIELDAFNRGWSTDFCDRAVAFEGYATVALVAICELIMILRVFALYGRNYWVLGFLTMALAGQIVISSVGLSVGMRAPLPPGFVGCIYTGSSTPTIRQFTKDGVLYFALIFSANIINVIIYEVAVEDLKAIGASFSQMITSVMISRLVLNLRGVGEEHSQQASTLQFNHQPNQNDIVTRTLGNLGGEFRPWEEEDEETTVDSARSSLWGANSIAGEGSRVVSPATMQRPLYQSW